MPPENFWLPFEIILNCSLLHAELHSMVKKSGILAQNVQNLPKISQNGKNYLK